MIKSFNGKEPRIADSAFISEWAYLIGDIEIAENSSVWPGAVIRADVGLISVSQNSHIEDNVVIHAPTEIGDNVIIGHGAVIHAHKIGNNVLIGMNSTIMHGVEIGDQCIIAAGSVLTDSMKIPAGSFVAGVPAEIRGQISEKQNKWINDAPKFYTQMAKSYKDQGF